MIGTDGYLRGNKSYYDHRNPLPYLTVTSIVTRAGAVARLRQGTMAAVQAPSGAYGKLTGGPRVAAIAETSVWSVADAVFARRVANGCLVKDG